MQRAPWCDFPSQIWAWPEQSFPQGGLEQAPAPYSKFQKVKNLDILITLLSSATHWSGQPSPSGWCSSEEIVGILEFGCAYYQFNLLQKKTNVTALTNSNAAILWAGSRAQIMPITSGGSCFRFALTTIRADQTIWNWPNWAQIVQPYQRRVASVFLNDSESRNSNVLCIFNNKV